jgi:hypothetical protein
LVSDDRDAMFLDTTCRAQQTAIVIVGIGADADAPLGVIAAFPGEPPAVIVDAALAAGVVAEPAGVWSVRRTFALSVAVASPPTGAGRDTRGGRFLFFLPSLLLRRRFTRAAREEERGKQATSQFG